MKTLIIAQQSIGNGKHVINTQTSQLSKKELYAMNLQTVIALFIIKQKP